MASNRSLISRQVKYFSNYSMFSSSKLSKFTSSIKIINFSIGISKKLLTKIAYLRTKKTVNMFINKKTPKVMYLMYSSLTRVSWNGSMFFFKSKNSTNTIFWNFEIIISLVLKYQLLCMISNLMSSFELYWAWIISINLLGISELNYFLKYWSKF